MAEPELFDASTDSEWLYKGAKALATFFQPDYACFLRATGPTLIQKPAVVGELPRETGGTSSNRAFLATLEVLFFLSEEGLFSRPEAIPRLPTRWQAVGEEARSNITQMVALYYSLDLDELREHGENGINDFTDSHLLVSLTWILLPFVTQHLDLRHGPDLAAWVRRLSTQLERQLLRGGARLSSSGPPHPFITFYALRAVEAARHVAGNEQGRSRVTNAVEAVLRTQAHHDVLHQLGLQDAKDAEFDPASLVGAVALLHRFASMSGRKLILRGLEVLAGSQGDDGSWGSRILIGNRQRIYIPSLELAVILANIALADVADKSPTLAQLAHPILVKSLAFLESDYREGIDSAGWANDQARQLDVVKFWSTALALQLLIRAKRVERKLSQHRTSRRYPVEFPERHRREWLRWPDLAGPISLVRSRQDEGDRAQKVLAGVSDPSASRVISTAVWDEVVSPVLSNLFIRPESSSSLLLFGPPGTRKNSLVQRIATALDWPLLTLSPPDFLHDGIERFEATAARIFDDLLALRRVVVLFDECEELFRRRNVVYSPEHRTQSDFITSGMLPRLQALRDKRWIVFVMANNTEFDELDPAVVRFGRLDGRQRIGHPDVAAQTEYLFKGLKMTNRQREIVRQVLQKYDKRLASRVSTDVP